MCWLSGGPSYAVDIKNFKSGLVCPSRESGKIGEGRICFETETVQITGQGKCIFNGQELPCTWFGFEFDYAAAEVGEQISCRSKSSFPINFGNPDGIVAEDTNAFEYVLDLEGSKGRFFNPQYAVFSATSPGGREKEEETICSSGSEELFRFKFRFIYPAREDR